MHRTILVSRRTLVSLDHYESKHSPNPKRDWTKSHLSLLNKKRVVE